MAKQAISVLIAAISKGDIEAVQQFLNNKENSIKEMLLPTTTDEQGTMTVLHKALIRTNNQLAIIEQLLNHSEAPLILNAENTYSHKKSLSFSNNILNNNDYIDSNIELGYRYASETALDMAANNKNTEILRTLLTHGAKLIEAKTSRPDNNEGPREKESALAMALYRYSTIENDESLKILLSTRDSEGRTVLHRAVTDGDETTVRALFEVFEDQEFIAYKDFKDLRDSEGNTAFDLAVNNAQINIASLFKQDIDEKDKDGKTRLFKAVEAHDLKLVDSLLLLGANPLTPGRHGTLPIEMAAYDGSEKITDILIQKIKENPDKSKNATALTDALREAAAQGHSQIVRKLLESGADINNQSDTGRTPLMLAIMSGDKSTVEALLESSAIDLKSIYDSGPIKFTAFDFAAYYLNKEIENLLLKKLEASGAQDSDITDIKSSMSAARKMELKDFQKAIQDDNTPQIKYHLEHRGINAGSLEQGELTPTLHRVLQAEHYDKDIIQALLALGADINQKDVSTGNTALHFAAMKKDVVLQQFIEKGADVLAINNKGETALHIAIQSNSSSAANQLIKADHHLLNIKDTQQKTALESAAFYGDKSMVSLFVKAGEAMPKEEKESIQKNIQQNINDGKKDFDNAIMGKDQEKIKTFLKYYKIDVEHKTPQELITILPEQAGLNDTNNNKNIIQALLALGADINQQDAEGNTALHFAAMKKHSIFQQLIEMGADVEALNNEDKTALDIALEDLNYDKTKLTEINEQYKNLDGNTPLMKAVEANDSKLVESLLLLGSDPLMSNQAQSTPLSMAAGFLNNEIENLLVNKCKPNKDIMDSMKAIRAKQLKAFEEAIKNPVDNKSQIENFLKHRGINVSSRDQQELTQNLHEALKNVASYLYEDNWSKHIYIKALLALGADINQQDAEGKTALHFAALIKDKSGKFNALDAQGSDSIKLIQTLIDNNKTNIIGSEVDNEGNTALHIAIKSNNTSAAVYLMRANPDLIEKENRDNKRALRLASFYGDDQMMSLLTSNMPSDDIADGKKDLNDAMTTQDQEKIKDFLNFHEIQLDSAALLKVIHSPENELHSNIMRALLALDPPIDKNQKDSATEETALHIAIRDGKANFVDALLAAGADINLEDKEGKTALHIAASYGKTDLVRALIDAGADINLKDREGKTAWELTAFYGHDDTMQIFQDKVSTPQDALRKIKGEGQTALNQAIAYTKKATAPYDAGAMIEHEKTIKTFLKYNGIHTESAFDLAIREHEAQYTDDGNVEPGSQEKLEQAKTDNKRIVKSAQDQFVEVNQLPDTELNGYIKQSLSALNPLVNPSDLVDQEGLNQKIDGLLRNKFPNKYEKETNAQKKLSDFQEAIDSQDINKIKDCLVACGIERSSLDDKKELTKMLHSVLSKAGLFDDINIIKGLITLGADINQQDPLGQTALHFAAIRGPETYVNELIKQGADVNCQDNDGNTPLHLAIKSSTFASITALLKANTDPSIQNKKGETSLHIAVGHFYLAVSFAVLDLLKEKFENNPTDDTDKINLFNLQDEKGQTALHTVVNGNFYGVIDKLLTLRKTALNITDNNDHKEFFDIKDTAGHTALYLAVNSGKNDVVNSLLTHGPAINNQDNSALQLAGFYGNDSMLSLFVKAGEAMTQQEQENTQDNINAGKKDFDDAITTKDEEKIKTFLKYYEIDVENKKPEDLSTMLYQRAGLNDSDNNKNIIQALLALGADINKKDVATDNTALHIAASYGNTNIVSALTNAGADINLENKERKKAWELAAFYGHDDTMQIFQANDLTLQAALLNIKGAGQTALNDAIDNATSIENKKTINAFLKYNGIKLSDIKEKFLELAKASPETERNINIIRSLVALQPNIIKDNKPVEDASTKMTALHLAAQIGNTEIVKLLIKANPEVKNVQDKSGNIALDYAVSGEHKQTIEAFIESYKNDNQKSDSLLQAAISQGNSSLVGILLDKGTTIDDAIVESYNHLDQYEKQSMGTSLAERIKEFTACKQDNNGKTELHKAILNNDYIPSSVKITSKSINLQDKADQTALHLAVLKGNSAIVKELLSEGADLNIQNKAGQTALHLAVAHPKIENQSDTANDEIVSLLLEHINKCSHNNTEYKSCIDAPDNNNNTALHLAASYQKNVSFGYYTEKADNNEIVKKLICAGANLNAKNQYGDTPLILAVHNHKGIVETLLSAKHDKDGGVSIDDKISISDKENTMGIKRIVNVNVQNNKGRTAIHHAIKLGLNTRTQQLLAADADTTIKDKEGHTPLYLGFSKVRSILNILKNLPVIMYRSLFSNKERIDSNRSSGIEPTHDSNPPASHHAKSIDSNSSSFGIGPFNMPLTKKQSVKTYTSSHSKHTPLVDPTLATNCLNTKQDNSPQHNGSQELK